jgi:hypothetical protein
MRMKDIAIYQSIKRLSIVYQHSKNLSVDSVYLAERLSPPTQGCAKDGYGSPKKFLGLNQNARRIT